jgi:hypothetical protein
MTILGSEDKKTVLVWIDASPSEQLPHESGIYLSFAACIIAKPIEWLGLSQYKDTQPPKRSHAALHLTQLIVEQHLLVDAMVVTAPIERIEQHGEQVLDQLAKVGKGRWDDDQRRRYVYEKKRIHRNVACVMGAYSSALGWIGVWAAEFTEQAGGEEVNFALDYLPSQPFEAMKLAEALTRGTDISEQWNQTRRHHPHLRFDFSFLDVVRPTELARHDIHGYIVVDWLAHAFDALVNPEDWVRRGSDRTHEQREAVASPYVALDALGLARAVSLDGAPVTPTQR